jgi:hypothetical protein
MVMELIVQKDSIEITKKGEEGSIIVDSNNKIIEKDEKTKTGITHTTDIGKQNLFKKHLVLGIVNYFKSIFVLISKKVEKIGVIKGINIFKIESVEILPVG